MSLILPYSTSILLTKLDAKCIELTSMPIFSTTVNTLICYDFDE